MTRLLLALLAALAVGGCGICHPTTKAVRDHCDRLCGSNGGVAVMCAYSRDTLNARCRCVDGATFWTDDDGKATP